MPTPEPSIYTAHAHAKINLILRVAAPLTSGLHPICSWMHPIDLHDTLTIERLTTQSSEFNLRWDDDSPVDWETSSDLIYKAHALLESHTGRALPVRITATKSIPAGGGLGGGSSNAASTMMGLNQIFDLKLTQEHLRSLAQTLGSDIPYFITTDPTTPPHPAVVSGIGDQIHPTPRATADLTLLIPPFGCPTGSIYAAFDRQQSQSSIDADAVHQSAARAVVQTHDLINDLARPARSAVPQLNDMMTTLEALGITPHLSGSGSTMFILGRLDQSTADAISAALPDLRIVPAKLI